MPVQPLTPQQVEKLREGLRLFQGGDFFECHEVWEGVWLQSSGEQKRFLQGLIQVAVAFHHLRNANFLGAHRLLQAAVGKLSSFPPGRDILDVDSLLAALAPLLDRLAAGPVDPRWPQPAIELKLPSDSAQRS